MSKECECGSYSFREGHPINPIIRGPVRIIPTNEISFAESFNWEPDEGYFARLRNGMYLSVLYLEKFDEVEERRAERAFQAAKAKARRRLD